MTALAYAPRASVFHRFVAKLPIVGGLVHDLKHNSEEAQLFFGLNILLLWALSGFAFGIAGVLAVAFTLVAVMFGTLLAIMVFSGQ